MNEYNHNNNTDNTNHTEKKEKHTVWYTIGAVIVIGLALFSFLAVKNKNVLEEEFPALVEETEVDEMQVIEKGTFVYRFSGIEWFTEVQTESISKVPETEVSFKFDEFSRRKEGTLVTFGKPYKLGLYAGDCASDNTIDTNVHEIFLGGVSCVQDDIHSSIALYQEGEEVIAYRTFSDTEDSIEFFRINFTEIVK
ncbi:MAG: hypothetical protein ACI9AR_000268 [Flavobacteriaceae bacterium]|jgi:hypothetical protein